MARTAFILPCFLATVNSMSNSLAATPTAQQNYEFFCDSDSYTITFVNVYIGYIKLITDFTNCGHDCLETMLAASVTLNGQLFQPVLTHDAGSEYRMDISQKEEINVVQELKIRTEVNLCVLEIQTCLTIASQRLCPRVDCVRAESCKGQNVSCLVPVCSDINDISHFTDHNFVFSSDGAQLLEKKIASCDTVLNKNQSFTFVSDVQVSVQRVSIVANVTSESSSYVDVYVSIYGANETTETVCGVQSLPDRRGYTVISNCPNKNVTKMTISFLVKAPHVEYQVCDIELFVCGDFYYGNKCTTRCSCQDHYEICDKITGKCWRSGCPIGYMGIACDKTCLGLGLYGYNCQSTCGNCKEGISSCDHVTGECLGGCQVGWTGTLCNQTCEFGVRYGINCSQTCGGCANKNCSIEDGLCLHGCEFGFQGPRCTPCSNNTYGYQCILECGHCKAGSSCDHMTGECLEGCQAGWTGIFCNQACELGVSYGINCSQTCGGCANNNCSIEDGSCLDGCRFGFQGRLCKPCSNNTYGDHCTQQCGHCQTPPCDPTTGNCPKSLCLRGYMGDKCSDLCAPMSYGLRCSQSCGKCLSNVTCDSFNGSCPTGCLPGWKPPLCQNKCDKGTYGNCSTRCGQCRGKCDTVTGVCPRGCKAGYKNKKCTEPCSDGKYGSNCMQDCGHCYNKVPCNKTSGKCPNSTCAFGYSFDNDVLCKKPCSTLGYYGQDCKQICGFCFYPPCNEQTGVCRDQGGPCKSNCCRAGYLNAYCNTTCPNGTYGMNCSKLCMDNCKNGCDHVSGVCREGCKNGWKDKYCNVSCSEGHYGANCSSKCGYCISNTCSIFYGECSTHCHPGYAGTHCKDHCPMGTFGDNCSEICGKCETACDHIMGNCSDCKAGYKGLYCKDKCDNNTYGKNCLLACGNCEKNDSCNHVTGTCQTCQLGFQPRMCQNQCDLGFYGYNCNLRCGHCVDGFRNCDPKTGRCTKGCKRGYWKDQCLIKCPNGTFGNECADKCGLCASGQVCNFDDGICPNGCQMGYVGSQCRASCPPGLYGSSCQDLCGECEGGQHYCRQSDGECMTACKPGFQGKTCNITCDDGFYGHLCQSTCGQCQQSLCRKSDGWCENGCLENWTGPTCSIPCGSSSPNKTSCEKDNCSICLATGSCLIRDGQCLQDCAPGKILPNCTEICPDGTFGYNCSRTCSHCIKVKNSTTCLPTTGSCTLGCMPGWSGQLCNEACLNGFYGENCSKQCGNCRGGDLACNKVDGVCTSGCEEDYQGEKCDLPPEPVNLSCVNCFGGLNACAHDTFVCQRGCIKGWLGDTCITEDASIFLKSTWVVPHDPQMEIIITGTVIILVFIASICSFYIYHTAIRDVGFFDKYDFGPDTRQRRSLKHRQKFRLENLDRPNLKSKH